MHALSPRLRGRLFLFICRKWAFIFLLGSGGARDIIKIAAGLRVPWSRAGFELLFYFTLLGAFLRTFKTSGDHFLFMESSRWPFVVQWRFWPQNLHRWPFLGKRESNLKPMGLCVPTGDDEDKIMTY